MIALISELFSAIVQVLVFCLIPFVFFCFRKDKSVSFSRYTGLYRPPAKAVGYIIPVALLIVVAGIGITFSSSGWRQILVLPGSVTGKIKAMGLTPASVVILLVTAWIKTALSEEILFRGFIASRLTSRLGFQVGNLLQAVLFGSLHLLLFGLLITATFLPLVMIFIFTTAAGWVLGFVKEKYAKGSIVPGWIAHGLGNTISYTLIAYYL